MKKLLGILAVVVAAVALSISSAVDVQSLSSGELNGISGGEAYCCVEVDYNHFNPGYAGEECIDGECVVYPENTNYSAKWVAGDYTADGCSYKAGPQSNCSFDGTLWCGNSSSYGTWAVWQNASCDGAIDYYDTTGTKSIGTSTGDLCE